MKLAKHITFYERSNRLIHQLLDKEGAYAPSPITSSHVNVPFFLFDKGRSGCNIGCIWDR